MDDAQDNQSSPPHFYLGPANLDPLEVNISSNVCRIQASKGIDALASQHRDEMRSLPSPGRSEGCFSSNSDGPSSAFTAQYAAQPDDKFVAFGSIRLRRDLQQHQDSFWCMSGIDGQVVFPDENLSDLIRRGWLRIQYVDHCSNAELGVGRIYLLPEDVERAARSSPKPFRKIIRWLAGIADISPETWSGKFDPDSPIDTYGIPSAAQEESLFYIFNTLDSPRSDVSHFSGSSYAQASMRDVANGSIPGIKTELYPYQTRSVASMLQREEDPAKSQDARKPRYVDLEGRPFHMDVFDGVIVRHSQLYIEPKGGILAETMGYGKTLVCLALILATRGFYPQVPEARLERPERPSYASTPSLLSMAARAVKHKGLPWKAEFHGLRRNGFHYDRCLEELQKYDREFGEPIFHPTTPGRKASKRESERTLRLCNATLIVVPPNLLVQWQHEIRKHTEPGALDVLVIDMSTKNIPHWRVLMDKDIVLISKNRLDQEYRDDDLNQGKRFRGTDKISSQLTELRWLRVVCDEGHSFASSTSRTRTMVMLDKISVERRWIISGTPSSSLIGVDVSLAVQDSPTHRRRKSLDAALEQRRLPDSAKQEERDMDRLRLIVVNFLKVQPWANQKGLDQANWKKYLSPFDSQGNRRCAPGLRPLLQSLMVRHRIKDIDTDITLPPLHNKTVYLEPTYYDKLTINLFILVLTANAITSERTDEDYMHHPKNRKTLDLLISNLRQSTFHWTGFTPEQVRETIKLCDSYLDKHVDTITDEDGVLLTEAIQHAQATLDDPGWNAFSKLHEIGAYIDNFPEEARQAWSLHGQGGTPTLMGTVQAREAQKYVRSHLHEADPSAGMVGAGMRAMTDAHRRAEEEAQRTKKGGTSNSATQGTSTTLTPGVAEEPKARASISRSSSSGSTRPSTPSPRKRPHTHHPTPCPTPIMPAMESSLARTTIRSFTSAKLNYLTSSLLSLPPTTKSLIFYDSPNTAFWLAEALELLSIPFLIYSHTLPHPLRARYLSQFNSPLHPVSNPFRVLLMDLRQASTGLHVASASRVYIVTPIWRREVEAQAVKRAHRIGQTEEVRVETLVLGGTIEEWMWRRRMGVGERGGATPGVGPAAGGSGVQGMGSGGWLEDEGVVGIIKRARFVGVDYESERGAAGGVDGGGLGVKMFAREQVNGDVSVGGDEDLAGMPMKKRQRKQEKRKVASKGVRFAEGPSVVVAVPSRAPVTPPPEASSREERPQHQSIFGGGATQSV